MGEKRARRDPGFFSPSLEQQLLEAPYLRHSVPVLPGLLELERDSRHVAADVDLPEQCNLMDNQHFRGFISFKLRIF